MSTILSVNLNKIALLRNSRGRGFPSVVDFGEMALKAGAQGLTIHPRPDQRHARYADIPALKSLCDKYGVELNVEGYPLPKLVDLCIEHKVHQMTLVPDAPDQITSDHGWIVSETKEFLTPILSKLRDAGVRSSLFMDTDPEEIRLAKAVGADRIELHTESYARSYENGTHEDHIRHFASAYQTSVAEGLGVNAGHDLDLANLGFFLKHVPAQEVSIGHALTIESLHQGWDATVKQYAKICQ